MEDNEKKQKKKGHGGAAAAGIAALLLLSAGGYFGFGGGRGGGEGDSLLPNTAPDAEAASEIVATAAPEPAATEAAADSGEADTVVIAVRENEISVGGAAVDASELEALLREKLSDGTAVVLRDEHAIKASYDEVTSILDRLDIAYTAE